MLKILKLTEEVSPKRRWRWTGAPEHPELTSPRGVSYEFKIGPGAWIRRKA